MMTSQATALVFSGILFTSIGGVGCSPPVRGNGHLVTDSRAATDFTQIENHTSLSVSVVEGSAYAVDVRIDSNLQPLVETSVEAGVLRIDETEPFDSTAQSYVEVVVPSLVAASNDGSGSLVITGVDQAGSLHLACAGSGALVFDGSAGALTVDASGSGSVDLRGTATQLSIRASGSGSVDASELQASGADLATTGSGSVSAVVNGDATLTATGSGSIDATLDGGTVTFMVTGSGNVVWTGDERVGGVCETGSGRVVHR
jgi:hypothetical protein